MQRPEIDAATGGLAEPGDFALCSKREQVDGIGGARGGEGAARPTRARTTTIYTASYRTAGGLAWLDTEVQRLDAIVVDVRLEPGGLPAVRRDALARRYGSNYRWLGHLLGNVNFRNGGPIQFRDSERGIEALHMLSRPIILLCCCQRPSECHRTTVAEMFTARFGGTVEHLTSDTSGRGGRKQRMLFHEEGQDGPEGYLQLSDNAGAEGRAGASEGTRRDGGSGSHPAGADPVPGGEGNRREAGGSATNATATRTPAKGEKGGTTMSRKRARTRNGGLEKRCSHGRREWSRCPCPWRYRRYYKGSAWPQGKEFSISLHRHLKLATTYVMDREEAEKHAAALEAQILSGVDPTAKPEQPEPPAAPFTFGDLARQYLAEHVKPPFFTSEKNRKNVGWEVEALKRVEVPVGNNGTARLEALPLSAIRKPHVEAVRETWMSRLTGREKQGRVGTNHMLRRLRAMFNFALDTDMTDATPFKKSGTDRPAVRLDHEAEEPRSRRLKHGEEARLLAAAVNDHIKHLVIAALDTGAREGELLSLQWSQVSVICGSCRSAVECPHVKKSIYLPPSKTKTRKGRTLPVSQRLLSVLEMRRLDPTGQPFGGTSFVFGNQVGEQMAFATFRKEWEDTVLLANGFTPERRRGKLSSASCESFKSIDLKFHDLRREAGSRMLDSGFPLTAVQKMLGHRRVTTTAIYLQVDDERLHREVEKIDRYHEEQARLAAQNPQPFVHDSSTERPAELSETMRIVH